MDMKDPSQLTRAFTEIANSGHVPHAALTEVGEELAELAGTADGELAQSLDRLARLVHPSLA